MFDDLIRDGDEMTGNGTAGRQLMGFMDGFERGLSGNYRYEIAGKAVVCSHCGGEEFDERSGQLNTAGASLLNLDWANATARVLVCQSCGHLEWFL